MTLRVTIDHIGAGGDGVAYHAGEAVYTPFAVEGDEVEIKLSGKKGRITHIHSASPDRTAPICKHFGRCGGCSLQHVTAEYYTRWKQQQVRIAMSHRGFEDANILPVEISPKGSRRRATFAVMGQGQGNAVIGFSERASHMTINILECPVMEPKIVAFLAPLRKFLGGQLKKRQKMKVQINLADNGLDVILETAGEPDLDLRMDIAAFAEMQDIARICWLDTKLKKPSHEILCERRKPSVTFAGRQVFPPPGAFLQATRQGEAALSHYMKEALKDVGKVADIFAGCGTFTMALIGDHAVHAVDGNLKMVTALKNSAHQMGKIRALTTEVRDLFLRPLLPHELKKYDGLVLDPPRAGAKDQVEEIINASVESLVMISCNPATFARDARALVDAGFIMGDILPVDQFLYSPHIEVIAEFKRRP